MKNKILDRSLLTRAALLLIALALPSVQGAEAPAAEASQGAPISLEDKLQSLSIPENRAPSSVKSERLYAVQTRYVPLRYRSEISIGGARNFTSDGYLSSNQVDLTYRFYLSDRWYLGAGGSYVFNSLNKSGERLLNQENLTPDAAYPKYRADLVVGFNVFYGKFRLSMDQVFYFDQYIALGPGLVGLDTGRQMAAVGDIGLVFWFGRMASLRVGMKDYFFKEQRVQSAGYVNSLLGHLDLGILL